MQIPGVNATPIGLPSTPSVSAAEGSKGFGDMLEQMIGNLNSVASNSTNAVSELASGKDVDLHQVVIASEMESISFNLALQVRNKVVDAYHEIMRMPI